MTLLATVLKTNENRDFKVHMIQNLDLIFNIEEKLFELRNQVKSQSSTMFDVLFDIWCYDPISCLSLSLLGQR